MKTFTKGNLTTVVDDDDRRIPAYLASGWKETETAEKPKDDADKRTEKAIDDANASESVNGDDTSKNAAPDKKVNDAIAAAKTAEAELDTVDDGLIKHTEAEGKSNG